MRKTASKTGPMHIPFYTMAAILAASATIRGKLVPKWHHSSTAAGAYGITRGTYDEAVKAHVVFDFSERSQDIAIWLISYNGAQWSIWDGQLDAAFSALNPTWSSLPGGSQQELTSDEAKQYFWSRLGEVPP